MKSDEEENAGGAKGKKVDPKRQKNFINKDRRIQFVPLLMRNVTQCLPAKSEMKANILFTQFEAKEREIDRDP